MFGSDSGAPCCGVPPKDVIMRPRTTTALAIAATAFAPPAAAFAAPEATDPPSPVRTALRAPLAGHLTVAAQMRAERRANIQDALTTRAVKLARREAEVSGDGFHGPAKRRRLHGEAPAELREHVEFLRADIREAREAAEAAEAAQSTEAVPAAAAGSTASPTLQAIAACESGGDPSTNTGNGFYGKYQFTQSTWESVGGVGNPAAASEAEQDMRAAMLYEREGSSPWPVCGG
jgi:transglycosylase-like protein